jgi:hypothetical protein
MKQTAKQKLEEARRIWNDDVSFLAGYDLKLMDLGHDLTWRDITSSEQQNIADSMMETAISRYRKAVR